MRQKKGYRVATFDWEHHPSMDFLKPAGFLFLSHRYVFLIPRIWPAHLAQVVHLHHAADGRQWCFPCRARLSKLGIAMPGYKWTVYPEYYGVARIAIRSPSKHNGCKASCMIGLMGLLWVYFRTIG